MKPVIPVTVVEYGKGIATWAQSDKFQVCESPIDEASLARLVRENNSKAVIVGPDRYSGQLYEALQGGMIARFGVGVDGISKEMCQKHNVTLTNTPGVLSQSVAEHAIALLGALARHVAELDRLMRSETWQPATGDELAGKNLLIAGFGQIGRCVARIAGAGFGMNVTAFDSVDLATAARNEGITNDQFLAKHHLKAYTTDIDQALPEADVVSVHLASNPATANFFNKERFAKFSDGAIFINTARGPVVDELALYEALANGKLSGAGIDVFVAEPYVPVNDKADLRKLDNVVLTPHVGSNSHASNLRMANDSMKNCLNFLAGDLDKLSRVW